MYTGNIIIQQVFRLHGGPFNANFISFLVSFTFYQFLNKLVGKINIKCLREELNIIQCSNGFNARDNRNINSDLPYHLYKIVIFIIIEEHLGNDIAGPCLHFLF